MAIQLIPRPFLKWAGGKTQLIDQLLLRLPYSFAVYHEPFLGGGALFFALFRKKKITRAILSDINPELIDTYIAIRDHVREVISLLADFPHNEQFYYEIRARDPWKMGLSERAARMIYLNKTGYNGLYRVNQKGQFNVPFGRYKSPDYCNVENLMAVSLALRDVDLLVSPFDDVLKRAKGGDFVYFDPPYAPISRTANFTSYHSSGFSDDDQRRLCDVCQQLAEALVSVMVSNSNAPIIKTLYTRSRGFYVGEVLANRAINSNASRRGKLTELIITTYPRTVAAQLRLLEKRKRQYKTREGRKL